MSNPTPSLITAEQAPSTKLRGSLGVASVVFIVVAAASPLGVIGGPAPLGIALGNGAGFPFTYLIVMGVLLLFAVGFTAATPLVRSAGAFYAYVDRGLGRSAGLGAAFTALLSYLTNEAALLGLIGPAIGGVLHSYGVPEAPWWVYAGIAFIVVVVIGYFNVELSGRVLAVLLIAEVLIVLALDAVVVFSGGGPEGYSTAIFDPSQILSGAPGFGVLFAVLSFIGFEATAVFRDESRNPDRTIPRATYIALIAIGLFYTLSSWVLVSANGQSDVVGIAQENPGTVLADTTSAYLGVVGGHIVQVLFATSLFACTLSFHNFNTRYFYSLSVRGVLPTKLGTAHPRHGSPARASLLTAAIVAALFLLAVVLGLDPITQFFTWFGGLCAVGVMLLLVLTSASVIAIFRKEKTALSLWKRVIAPALALIGLLGFLVLILVNLPVLVGESGYGPLSWGVIGLIVIAFIAGPIVGRRKKNIDLA